jgi:acyl-CoA reductase-like NAD-dependent aldehyde dehydrogenase
MAVEIGKPLSYGLEEVRRAIQNLKDVAHYAATHVQQKRETTGIVRYQPLGLVAIISAWNNPVAIPLGKIAPALAYGNTVVWKPAPAATHIAQVVLQLLLQAGMPVNAVRLLTGDNTTARQLAANVNVNAVTITGSILSGYAMQEICARRIVPLQAELSGNNAAIVWDDADIVHAASQVAWGAFAFAGQRCTANRRVIVHASQFESFIRELEMAANQLTWDDPLKEETVIGPVISLGKRDEITAMVDRIQSNNDAQRVMLLHGARAEQPWVKDGAYMRPVIICCDHSNHTIVQEETMGPLLVVQRADDFEQALALCNGVRHGLVAALFSNSPDLQRQFLEETHAGVLKFNESTAGVDVALPFGGWKASGIGPPEHSEGDRCFYTRIQAVYGKAQVRFDSRISEE